MTDLWRIIGPDAINSNIVFFTHVRHIFYILNVTRLLLPMLHRIANEGNIRPLFSFL